MASMIIIIIIIIIIMHRPIRRAAGRPAGALSGIVRMVCIVSIIVMYIECNRMVSMYRIVCIV